VAEGVEAIERVLASGVVPSVVDYLDGRTLAVAVGAPFDVPEGTGMALLCEVDTREEDVAELIEALGETASRPDPTELWRWRDGIGLAVDGWRGGRISEDVAVPLHRLAEAIERSVALGPAHGIDACSWGHAGDGNLHSSFVFDPATPDGRAAAEAAAEDLFAMAIEMGGTITGEHGIGWLKRGWLSRQWAPAAVRLHEEIKRTLDPKGLFNPGKKAA
jgi:FAD/FMN-containing dehydrogenase